VQRRRLLGQHERIAHRHHQDGRPQADAVAVWFGDAEGFGERMERFAAALR
jgi:hypothetical protein